MEKMAISMQRRSDGIPIRRSGPWKRWEGLMAPLDVRKEMRMVCQNDRKMTSFMAATLSKGLCSARSSLS